jgi:hypothetical protein
MPFVIRASDRVGDVGWVLPVNARGLRTIGTRAEADVFTDQAEAKAVVQRMEKVFSILELEYSVEAESSTNVARGSANS